MMQFLAGWLALGCGALNLALTKGTRGHRAFGMLFVICMGLAAIEAVARGILDLFVALVLLGSGATIWALVRFVRRRPGWVTRHARRMQAAYVALAAAASLLLAVGGGWMVSPQQAEVRRVARRFERGSM